MTQVDQTGSAAGDQATDLTPDLIVAPRWLIPVEPADTVLTDHVVAIANGKLLAIAERDHARANWPETEWQERPEHVLIPGLINTHTHAPMTLLRGYADDLPLDQWLSEHIWPAEQRCAGPEFVRDGADLAMVVGVVVGARKMKKREKSVGTFVLVAYVSRSRTFDMSLLF